MPQIVICQHLSVASEISAVLAESSARQLTLQKGESKD